MRNGRAVALPFLMPADRALCHYAIPGTIRTHARGVALFNERFAELQFTEVIALVGDEYDRGSQIDVLQLDEYRVSLEAFFTDAGVAANAVAEDRAVAESLRARCWWRISRY